MRAKREWFENEIFKENISRQWSNHNDGS
jgi:hypothetical protein